MIARTGGATGQAVVIVALALTVLCGVLALGVDVGLTTARYGALRNAADAAADAGAYTTYGRRTGANTATDAMVWSVMTSTLTSSGLAVENSPGALPADPCAAHYSVNQVAMTATYLDAQNAVVTDSSGQAVIVGAASGNAIPSNAWGVKITALSACQPAAFGAVLGRPFYPIAVAAAAGQPLQGTALTPVATPATATPTPASTPTQAAATATPLPPIIQ